jgi:hypothetical protein
VKRSVGLLFLTRWQGALVAVLNARGQYNFEKMKAESWPGLCQVSTHGEIEDVDGGNHVAALVREAGQELGNTAAQIIDERFAEMKQIGYKKDDREEVTTYALYVADPEFLKYVQLSSDSGGLRLAHYGDERLCSTDGLTKTEGVRDMNVFAMFPDELAAVRKALVLYQAA